MELDEKAKIFATQAHALVSNPDGTLGQKRKYTGESYITHPRDVVSILEKAGESDPEVLATGWLHDVLEDTEIQLPKIAEIFGPKVAQLVSDLTDRYTKEAYPHLDREHRKEFEAARLAKIHPDARRVKLADLISNTSSIVEEDPKFASTYLAEKERLLGGFPKDPEHPVEARLRIAASEKLRQARLLLNKTRKSTKSGPVQGHH